VLVLVLVHDYEYEDEYDFEHVGISTGEVRLRRTAFRSPTDVLS